MKWTATGEIPACTSEQVALYVDALVATGDECDCIEIEDDEEEHL